MKNALTRLNVLYLCKVIFALFLLVIFCLNLFYYNNDKKNSIPSINESLENLPHSIIFSPLSDQIKFDPNQPTRLEDSDWIMYSDYANYIYHLVQEGNFLYLGISGMGVVKYDVNKKSIETVYTMRDGLLSNNISSLLIVEDELWIGCQFGGITKISLKESLVKQYTDKSGLPDLRNIDLSYDGETIWVGTSNGVARYDKAHDSFITYQHVLLPTATLWSSSITTNEGEVWATMNANDASTGGLARYNSNNDSWESYGIDFFEKAASDFRIDFRREPLITKEKVWIVTTENKLFEFDTYSKKWTNRGEIVDEVNTRIDKEDIYQPILLKYESPYLIIGGEDAIYSYDALEKKAIKNIDQSLIRGYTNDRVISYKDNILWFYEVNIIHRYNEATQNIESYELFPQVANIPDEIYGLIAKTNTDLILHTNRGYERYSPSEDRFEIIYKKSYTDGSPMPASGIFNNDNTVWIYDLNCYNSVVSRCSPPSLWKLNLDDYHLNSVDLPDLPYFDRLITIDTYNSRLFFSASRGYAEYSIENNDWDLHLDIFDYYEYIRGIKLDLDQNLWVWTSEGLGILNEEKIDYIKDFPQDTDIYDISLEGNYIWIMAEDLYKYDLTKKTYQLIELPPYENLLPKDDWFTLRGTAFEQDTLWLSTNLGIFKYKDNEWEIIDHRDGLYTNKVSGIHVIGNSICMLTNARNYGLICSKSLEI